MSRIPGPDGLGQRQIEVRRTATSAPSDALQQGAQHLATRLGQIADDGMQRQEEADRLKTAADLSRYETSVSVLRKRVQDDLTGGKYESRQDAMRAYQEESQTLTDSLYERVPTRLRDAARARGDEVLTKQSLGLGEFLDQHATSEARGSDAVVAKGLMTQGLGSEEDLAKVKQQRGIALQANQRALRYSPEEASKLATDFNADATFMHFSERLAERPEDIKYILELRTRLSDEKQLTDLDAARRTQLLHTTNSLENQWEAEQRRRQAESEARIATDAADMREFLLNGGDVTALPTRDRSRLSSVLTSEKYGPKAQGWLKTNRAVTTLNTLPIREQSAALLKAETALQGAKGVDDYNDAHDTLAALQASHNRNLQEFKADPFTYTATNLLKEPVVAINWADAATLPQQLAARREQAGRASRMNGTRVPPVTASDAETIARITNSMPPQDGAKFLQVVSGSVGLESMPLVAQLLGKDGDPVLVGAAALAGKSSTDGRSVSALALRGREVIKGKEVKLPEETGMRATFAAGTGMSGQGMELAFQTAQAIYAAKAREEGIVEPVSGKPDQRLWRNAVALATGGVYDYKGTKLVAPVYGLSQSEFEDRLSQVKPEDIQRDADGKKLYVDGREISYDKASEYIRQAPVGNGSRAGTVWVRAGSGMIMQEDGSPLQVTLPAAASPSGPVKLRVNTSMMMPGM